MNWRNQAVCFNDENSSYWVSYNFDKVKYAKDGCSRCSVIKECLMYSANDDEVIGVIGGSSEFDRLMMLNKERGD